MITIFRTAVLALTLAFALPVMAAPLDINAATAEQLAERLSGIGEKKAESIVQYRKDNGPFGSVEDLAEVPGIGAKTIERNRAEMIVRSVDEREADRNDKADQANAGGEESN